MHSIPAALPLLRHVDDGDAGGLLVRGLRRSLRCVLLNRFHHALRGGAEEWGAVLLHPFHAAAGGRASDLEARHDVARDQLVAAPLGVAVGPVVADREERAEAAG